jgi:hypothetical protein
VECAIAAEGKAERDMEIKQTFFVIFTFRKNT